jgi:hypothetical protein
MVKFILILCSILYAEKIENGNIDLLNRPVVYNIDNSFSTVLSISINIDNIEIIIPLIDEQGNVLNEQEAIQLYLSTGKHLGKYTTVQEAINEAIKIHNEQEKFLKGYK